MILNKIPVTISTMNENNLNIKKESFKNKCIFTGLLFLLILTIFVVHRPALSAKVLSFDDDQYLTENVLVQNPSWNSAKRFLTEVLEPSTVSGYYQPLTMISLMIDYAISGDINNLKPFHLTSLCLHIANTVLIVMLLYLLFGNIWVSVICGFLFGLHPMTVETIAWIGERKTLLASFFAFSSILFYVLFTQKRKWFFYLPSLILFLLALMSKPTPVMLPLLLLLLDFWPLNKFNYKIVFEKAPFFALSLLFALVTFISQASTAEAKFGGGYGILKSWLIISHNIVFYPMKILYPVNLSSFYPFPEPFDISNSLLLTSIFISIILIVVLIISIKKTKAPLLGCLFFFIAILPTMQIIRFSNVIASDKFAYFSSFGFLIIICAFGAWLLKKTNITIKSFLIILVLIIVASEAKLTRNYLTKWENTEVFCKHMLTLTPNAPSVHYLLAKCYQDQGQLNNALYHYEKTVRFEPNNPYNHNNIGTVFATLGDIEQAGLNFEKAVLLKPDFAEARYNLANTLRIVGQIEKAIIEFNKTLEYDNDYYRAHNNLGNIYLEQKDPNKAISHFKRAIDIKPNFYKAYNNLGLAYLQQGRFDQAIANFKKAIEINPDYTHAQKYLQHTLKLKQKQADKNTNQ